MSLKFSDALHLSWSNIAQYKKRSTLIILTVSILFGIVLGFSFMLEGLGETTFDAAMQASDGKIYIATSYAEIAPNNEGYYERINNLDDAKKLITENAEQYHGEVIGRIAQYNTASSRWVMNQELAERFSDLDFSILQDGQLPYLGPVIEDEYFNKYLKDPDDNKDKALVKIGTYPSTEPEKPTLPGFNPLNLLLSGVHGSDAYPLIIDDGSGKIMQYLQDQASRTPSAQGQEIIPYLDQIVVMFDNYDDAIAYYWDTANGKSIPKHIETADGRKYSLHSGEMFSDVIGAELTVKNQKVYLIMAEVLFIIIAAIITILTFAHLIDQDASAIALYRSLGASTGDIYLIYFLYLLEMCVLAVLACIVIAGVLAGILWLFNANALAQRLQDFYMLDNAPRIVLFGFTDIFTGIIISIMIVAPITFIFSLRHFSRKNIAKKLKED